MTIQKSHIPVHLLPHNKELIKSMGYEKEKSVTDFQDEPTLAVYEPGPQPEYRVPQFRVSGNTMFRRYADGSLDVDYAVHKVLDAVHEAKRMGLDVLDSLGRTALGVMFPESFDTVDGSMIRHVAEVQLRISMQEREMIRLKVAMHLAEELNWNAGRGGGSVPGRSSTTT